MPLPDIRFPIESEFGEKTRLEMAARMESTLEIHKQFLLGGYAARYTLSCRLPTFHISVLTDLALKLLVPESALAAEPIRNLKGRDAQPAAEDLPAPWRPRGEELFFAAGKLFLPSTAAERLSDDFEVRVLTTFLDFQGSHHIRHSVHMERSPALPPFFRIERLGRAFPLEIQAVRVGLELFESRRYAASFGFSPTVTQTLQLECYGDLLKITVTAESLRRRDTLPLAADGLIDRVDRIALQLCGKKLSDDYRSKLDRAG